MAREPEIDWTLVAKKIVSTLGVETARGLLYGIMASAVTPMMLEKIRDMVSGKAKEDEVVKEIREILSRQQFPQQQAPQDVERMLAQLLQQSQRGQVPTAFSPLQPTPRTTPWLQEEIESVRREISTYEAIRSELLMKRYSTFDEQTIRQIDDRLREVESKLMELRNRYNTLQRQAAWGY